MFQGACKLEDDYIYKRDFRQDFLVNKNNQELICVDRNLKALPSNLTPQTTVLDLSRNQLQTLEGIDVASGLEKLILVRNSLQTLEGIQFLINLQAFNCAENRITTLPDLSRLKTLSEVDLRQNFLAPEGCLGLLGCSFLQSLDLSNNQLTRIPDLRNLTILQSLQLSGNKLQQLQLIDDRLCPLPGTIKDLGLDFNLISTLGDLKILAALPSLVALKIKGNPCIQEAESCGVDWQPFVIFLAQKLQSLDDQTTKETTRQLSMSLFRDSTGRLVSSLPYDLDPSNNTQLLSYLKQTCPGKSFWPPVPPEQENQLHEPTTKAGAPRKSLAALLAAKKAPNVQEPSPVTTPDNFAQNIGSVSSPKHYESELIFNGHEIQIPHPQKPQGLVHSPRREQDNSFFKDQDFRTAKSDFQQQKAEESYFDIRVEQNVWHPQNAGSMLTNNNSSGFSSTLGPSAISETGELCSSHEKEKDSSKPSHDDFLTLQQELSSLKLLMAVIQNKLAIHNEQDDSMMAQPSQCKWKSSREASVFIKGVFVDDDTSCDETHLKAESGELHIENISFNRKFPTVKSAALRLLAVPCSEIPVTPGLRFGKGSLVWLVVRLQALVRGFLVRSALIEPKHMKRSSIKIQSVFRGFQVRSRVNSSAPSPSKYLPSSMSNQHIRHLEHRLRDQERIITETMPQLQKKVQLLEEQACQSAQREENLKAAVVMLWHEVQEIKQTTMTKKDLTYHV